MTPLTAICSQRRICQYCCMGALLITSSVIVTVPLLYQVGIEPCAFLWESIHLENPEIQLPSAFVAFYGTMGIGEISASGFDS